MANGEWLYRACAVFACEARQNARRASRGRLCQVPLAVQRDNQIETDAKSYRPFTWFGRTRSPNLLQWVSRSKETVLAMLYGKLPHP
jgi:hypothetical protein